MFRLTSYLVLALGVLSLVVSGGLGLAPVVVYAIVMFLSARIEGTRWELRDRFALLLLAAAIPLFYLDWIFLESLETSGRLGAGFGDDIVGRAASLLFGGGLGGHIIARARVGVAVLAHITLFLSGLKLVQRKHDRDWVFLYLISFFQILLAAALSVTPLFLVVLVLYMLCAIAVTIAFEIRGARRGLKEVETRLLLAPDSKLIMRLARRRSRVRSLENRKLPLVAVVLLLLIFSFAAPLFLVMPRYGVSAFSRADAPLAGFVGFSDSVTLGSIGRLQQNDRIVMRVRIENARTREAAKSVKAAAYPQLRWRGVALDEFTGTTWRRSGPRWAVDQPANERGFFQLGRVENLQNLTTQTFYLEPIDTPVLFAAPRVVAVQAGLPSLRRDGEGALYTSPHDDQRVVYKVHSDTTEPDSQSLRSDREPYADDLRYLQLPPNLDLRIRDLATDVIRRAGARNRYDAARSIESFLQSEQNFRYSLDLRPSGADPLSDFLFNVREGHCEYFATSMAVMLRSIGVATRVVNGFQMGEYNENADVFTVTERDAHSWVEVYFPATDTWVTFDPTPAAGRLTRASSGFRARLNKLAEALELMWIQYVVGYDRNAQRAMATSVGNGAYDVRHSLTQKYERLKRGILEWLRGGDQSASLTSVYLRAGILLFVAIAIAFSIIRLVRRIKRLGFRRAILFWKVERSPTHVIEFYDRMQRALAARGYERAEHQTPLEFAASVGLPDALNLTLVYNRIRFGQSKLTAAESREIENWISRIEGAE